jgi:hypothetical protein
VFTRVYRLEMADFLCTVSHIGIFDPALLTVALLTFSLVQLSHPLTYVNKYTVSKGGRGVWGHIGQIDKHLPQSPFTGEFFR